MISFIGKTYNLTGEICWRYRSNVGENDTQNWLASALLDKIPGEVVQICHDISGEIKVP